MDASVSSPSCADSSLLRVIRRMHPSLADGVRSLAGDRRRYRRWIRPSGIASDTGSAIALSAAERTIGRCLEAIRRPEKPGLQRRRNGLCPCVRRWLAAEGYPRDARRSRSMSARAGSQRIEVFSGVPVPVDAESDSECSRDAPRYRPRLSRRPDRRDLVWTRFSRGSRT